MHLANERLRRQCLAVLVITNVIALAAAAGVLVKRVRGKRHLVPDASADEVTDRLADRLANQVEAGGLDRGVGAGVGVERVFAGDTVGLRSLQSGRATVDHRGEIASQPVRASADDLFPDRLQRPGRLVATVRLGNAGNPVVAFQLDHVAQCIRLMQTVAAAQRRVGHGNRVNPEIADAH